MMALRFRLSGIRNGPVVVNPGELPAQEQPEATDGEADRDDEAELPIIKNPEQPEATDGEAEPEPEAG